MKVETTDYTSGKVIRGQLVFCHFLNDNYNWTVPGSKLVGTSAALRAVSELLAVKKVQEFSL